MVLNQDEDQVDFSGWVTIDNNSGKKYENTKIKLITGDVNTVPQPTPRFFAMTLAANPVSPPAFAEKSFGDYHMYTLDQRVNVKESSRKQIELLPKAYGVNVNKKTYFVSLDTGGYSQENLKFQSRISFLNSKDNRMGIPLPAGTVRVFKKDQADGSLEFIGESNIRHTPRDENVTVTTGNAFDLVGKLTAISRISVTNGYDATMQLNVTNRSGKPADMVLILTNYNSDNNALKGTTGIDWTKISANMFEIRLTAAANETKSVGWTERHRD